MTLEELIQKSHTTHAAVSGKFIQEKISEAIQKLKTENKLEELLKTSFTEMQDWVMTTLGYPIIQINLDDKHYQLAFKKTVSLWHQHHYDGSRVSYVVIPVTTEMITSKRITGAAFDDIDAILDVKLYPSALTVTDPIFGSTFDLIQDVKMNNYSDSFYSSMSLDSLSNSYTLPSFLAMEQSLSDIQRLMLRPMVFNYHKSERYLEILDSRLNGMSVGDNVVIECYTNVTIDDVKDILNEPWVRDYMVSYCKLLWGQVLRMVRGTPVLAGNSIDFSDMLNEAQQEVQALELQLRETYELPPRMAWG